MTTFLDCMAKYKGKRTATLQRIMIDRIAGILNENGHDFLAYGLYAIIGGTSGRDQLIEFLAEEDFNSSVAGDLNTHFAQRDYLANAVPMGHA